MDREIGLNRYAELIVKQGLNVQPGQLVNISCEVFHRELALLIAKKAYEAGAGYVMIDLTEPRLTPLRVAHNSEELMAFIPEYITPKYREMVTSKGANLKIVGLEEPDLLEQTDPRKLNIARRAVYKAMEYFYEEGIGKSLVHWTVVAAATPKWGQRLFPTLTPTAAESRLWDEIFAACRLQSSDFLDAWTKHDASLHRRAQRLTELKIDSLRFVGPGTDLTVGLSDRAIFKGGSDLGPRGVPFQPNIPTEECFTTPDYRRTAGTARCTRPFLINGKLISDLTLRFEQGKIVDFSASNGAETFREYISSDPGASRLGEVALVGIDSPIYKSGIVFEEILFDENAACHIAVGSAYKFCIRGGESLTETEAESIGCNESSAHTDMMISSPQVSVVATLRDGSTRELLHDGQWCDL